VIGYHAATTQTGGGQEAVDGPFLGVGMLGHGGEDAPCDAPDVARLKVLGQHRCYDLVARAAADSRGIFGAAEDRVSAEEWRGYEPGHGGFGPNFDVFDYNHI
jgi:hypothetical protein